MAKGASGLLDIRLALSPKISGKIYPGFAGDGRQLFAIKSLENRRLFAKKCCLGNLCNPVYSSELYKDVNFLLRKYDIVNLDLNSASKRDVKHIFTCIITRIAVRQWEVVLDEPLQ